MSEHFLKPRPSQRRYADFLTDNTGAAGSDLLPSIPISLATRIRLEMLVMRTSVLNLRDITDTILRDPGATLQLLRVAGEEYQGDEGRPTRIEHCIALMNHERWYETVCSAVIDSEDQHVLKTWKQFRRNAHHTREAAIRLQGFCPDEAYLVGLLHQIGKLPHLLGWTSENAYTALEEGAVGILLAQSWRVPGFLMEALREQQQSVGSRWNVLLRAAQQETEQQLRTESAFHDACLATSFIC